MQNLPAHLERILNLARWAPSGDNTQPWRFKILGDEHILVQGFDTRDHVVYDLDGHASQLAIGGLLETIVIAATGEGRSTSVKRRTETPDTHLLFDVQFQQQTDFRPSTLLPYIEARVVQRRPMHTKSLSVEQKQALEKSLPDGYSVIWIDRFLQRFKMAKLLFSSAKIRLTIPEAYAAHKSAIEWGAKFSANRIPSRAIGVDPVTECLMRWVMASWERVRFFNTYLFGHFAPRLQLDFVPGVLCAAHFTLTAPKPLGTIDDFVAAGRVMQRFWLSASQLGWLIQPEMTPLIFARFHRQELVFSQIHLAQLQAKSINSRLQGITGAETIEKVYLLGRIGAGPMPSARSTRKALADLVTLSAPLSSLES